MKSTQFIPTEEIPKSLDLLREYIQAYCLVLPDPNEKYAEDVPKGLFPSKINASNRGMAYQFLPRRIMYNPGASITVSLILLNTLAHHVKSGHLDSNFQLAGVESSCIPLIVQMQTLAFNFQSEIGIKPFNIFSVRKERNDYGVHNFVNGELSDGVVVFVDDLFNSGKTFFHFERVVNDELGLSIYNNIFTILTTLTDRPFNIEGRYGLYQCYSLFLKDEFEYDNAENIIGEKTTCF